MTELEIFQRLAVALSIGTLVGLERGWQTRVACPAPGRRHSTHSLTPA